MISEEIRASICEQLADGKSLREICRQYGMPACSTVFVELSRDQAFAEQYARAKQAGIEAMADDLLAIANTPVLGMIRTTKGDGSIEEKVADMIEHRRLQVDARKWLLSKLAPKKYGDKLQHTGDGGGPVIGRIELVPMTAKPGNGSDGSKD